ncbi:MAG TPA: cytochrome c oxidase subunit II [Candidatus Sulfomarinibacteraceae bacterium]|nr:cytochrome c oxidase subunit II [Candidatus Sulfomarinibacteraceae bacterium]
MSTGSNRQWDKQSDGSVSRCSRASLLIVLAFLVVAGAACANGPDGAGIPSSLDARGPAADSIAFLWWVLLGLGTIVFAIVGVVLLYVAFWGRRQSRADGALIDEAGGRRWIWWGGLVLPLLVLPVAYFFNLSSLSALNQLGDTATVTIDVVGHRWWWEVRYPDEDVVTANEIHIPVGQPVELRLTSADVIHSFWVPQLQGKMDMNPGDINTLTLQADEAGEYRGICAEFCGAQHARMAFIVVASPPEVFEQWLEQQRQPAPQPASDDAFRGQQVFLGSACVYCHTVRGTNASGEVGPDLTHLMSRRTLAAGTLENNRGNLAGWILDPQHIKPGNLMPPTALPAEDFQPLLEYLDTLE